MTSPDTGDLHRAGGALVACDERPGERRRRAGGVKEASDLEQYKGKLGGKIVLLGEMREVGLDDQALFHRYDEKELQELSELSRSRRTAADRQARLKAFVQRQKLTAASAKFLADEKPLVVIRPSRDSEKHGGSGGTIFDDNGATIGRDPYKKENAVPHPGGGDGNRELRTYGRLLKAECR